MASTLILLVVTCIACVSCSQEACRGDSYAFLLSCSNVNSETRFTNLDGVEVVRFENARGLGLTELTREDLPNLKRIEVINSPKAKCSWFKGWYNVTIVINDRRCNQWNQSDLTTYSSSTRKTTRRWSFGVRSKTPTPTPTLNTHSTTELGTETTTNLTGTSVTTTEPVFDNFQPGNMVTLQIRELIFILLATILITMFLVSFGFHLCMKQQQMFGCCKRQPNTGILIPVCCKKTRDGRERKRQGFEVNFKNTSFISTSETDSIDSDVIFELPNIPTSQSIRQRRSRTPSPMYNA